MSDEQEVDLAEAVCVSLDSYMAEWEESCMKTVAAKTDLDEMALSYGKVKGSLKNTREILQACDVLGIDLISIGKETRYIKKTETWPFKHHRSLFTRPHPCPEGLQRVSNLPKSPAVWEITSMVEGLKGSAGNTDQKQFTGHVVPGVFLKRDGEWCYVVK